MRDNCPRHLYAPEQSPGAQLRTGSGDTDASRLLRHLGKHEAATVAQLVAAGVDLERGTVGPWLTLWALQRLRRNRQPASAAARSGPLELLRKLRGSNRRVPGEARRDG